MCKLCAVESPVMFPGVATVGAGTVRTLYKHTETEHTRLRLVYSQRLKQDIQLLSQYTQ